MTKSAVKGKPKGKRPAIKRSVSILWKVFFVGLALAILIVDRG